MSEKGIVFFPERFIEATPKDYQLEAYEDVFFSAQDGTRLHGWFVHGSDERAVLLWFHGNQAVCVTGTPRERSRHRTPQKSHLRTTASTDVNDGLLLMSCEAVGYRCHSYGLSLLGKTSLDYGSSTETYGIAYSQPSG